MDGAIHTPHRLIIAGLVVAAIAVYANAFSGSFQFDDFATITENPHLTGWKTFAGHLDHMVRPVLYATFLADRALFDRREAGYHALNLLLHLGCGILVSLVLARAVTDNDRRVPLWTAALFLIHPIQTETVTYISGRATGLMAFFYLLAFVFYLKMTDCARDAPSRWAYLSASLVLFALALGSKETAVTFPLALLLWEATIRRGHGDVLAGSFVSRHLPYWLVLLASAAWAWRHPRYSELARFSLDIRPLTDNLLSEAHAAASALVLLFCPWKQNFDHDLPVLHSMFEWPLPLDLLILGGVVAAALLAARRLPVLSFGLGWFLVQLLPTSLLPRNDLLSERNLYLASIGILLAAVVLASRLAQQLSGLLQRPKLVRIGALALASLLVAALAFTTVQRNALYRDPVLLWSDAVAKSPRKARPHNNLGHAYAMQQDWDRAIDEFRIAARLDPDYAVAQQNLRDAYLHRAGRK